MKLVKKKKRFISATPRKIRVVALAVLALVGAFLLGAAGFWLVAEVHAQAEIITLRTKLRNLVGVDSTMDPAIRFLGDGGMRFTAFLKGPECAPPASDRVAAVLRDNRFILRLQYVGACHVEWIIGRQ